MIKHKYIKTLIISLNWDIKFHIHKNASLLVVGVMLAHNLTRKRDQPVVYTSRFLNKVERNYNTIEHETLVIVFTLHMFKHYLLGNKFVSYVDHRAMVDIVNKQHVLGHIAR